MTRGHRVHIFGCCHFYVRHVHVYGTCCALVRAFDCVGFRRVCISLGWSCGVLLMRASEVKSVLGNTFRVLRALAKCFFSRAVGGAAVVSDYRLKLWSTRLRFGIGDLESHALWACRLGYLCQYEDAGGAIDCD